MEFDYERFRLRRFFDRLIERDEVEIHKDGVALTGLSVLIEATPKAVCSSRRARKAWN